MQQSAKPQVSPVQPLRSRGLTKAQAEVGSASYFINSGFIHLKVAARLACAGVPRLGPGGPLESFIILTGTDTPSVHQATILATFSLGEQLYVNSQLCVIPYGSNISSSSLNI